MKHAPDFYSQLTKAPFTALACAFCLAVFIALNLEGSDISWATAARWGYFPDSVIWEGKPWALLTSTFVHLELMHFAFNMYWLWVLGSCFEVTLGWGRWLLFFVAAAWVSSAFQLLLTGSSGIGMSGVGYALFGFGWVARRQLPRFAEVVDDNTVKVFLVWLVLCVVLTQLNVMQIANAAHFFGLAFGVCVAALFVLQWRPWGPAAGLLLLLGVSFAPLKWCPLSADWTALEAINANRQKDYPAAIALYRRSLELGSDPAWVWASLAAIYAREQNESEYVKAVQELRKINPELARDLPPDLGAPK